MNRKFSYALGLCSPGGGFGYIADDGEEDQDDAAGDGKAAKDAKDFRKCCAHRGHPPIIFDGANSAAKSCTSYRRISPVSILKRRGGIIRRSRTF